jgi:Kef-type K+ transport system membrane component KefB
VELLKLETPHGTEWELFLVVVVIVAAPILVEKLRIPGLIGLLVGGCLLGPNVFGVVSDSDGILKELGSVGLLYLMFMAGAELDLGVFAKYKKQAIVFALLTFAIPLGLGLIGGLLIDYELNSALLLGSLFASYTLVVYPTIRNMGLSSNRAVAVTVGATVITDTLALVVLAAVSGSATGEASGFELFSQIVLGLALVALLSFVVLPRVAVWFFRGPGRARTLRYMFVLGALLGAGVLSEVVGIEPIVGAFFAGLGLNRMVPNEGEFMERLEFFGSALFVPMFLVSVGTVIDPEVMVDPGTLGLAAVFCAACIGGKAIAATLAKPLVGMSWDETGVVFGLSVAQAAATLAATFVGLEIGLFTTATVNAVMILIVVSLILAAVSAERFGSRLPKPPVDTTRLGRSVLVQLDDPGDAPTMIRLVRRIAAADAGVARPVVVVPDGQAAPDEARLATLHEAIEASGADLELEVRHDLGPTDGLLHAASSYSSSLVLVPAATQTWLPSLFEASQHRLVATSPVPTALVRVGTARPERTVLVLGGPQAKRPTSAAELAVQLAARLAKGDALILVAGADPDPRLLEIAKGADVVVRDPHDWLAEQGLPSDVYVVPGGRNGALATARFTKAASRLGASILVIADRASVSAADRAAEGLGIVSTRTSGA